MATMHIRYSIRLSPDRVEIFDIHLDAETVEVQSPGPAEPPPWTVLGFHECPNCPLDAQTHPRCPLALSIADVVRRFDDVISHDEVDVEVATPQRLISSRTSSQIALRSIMGLLIACSGCPRTAFFKPMARFHLPFSDPDETMSRAVGAWLSAQYFRHADGKEATLSLAGLQEIYAQMQIVNRGTAERLRAATRTDSSLNAVTMLDAHALLAPYFIESALEEMRGPFEAILAQLDEGSTAAAH